MDQEKIWDTIYNKEPEKWKLESPLPNILKGKNVLEIGAGNGKTLKSILAQKPKELVAIDISSKAIKVLTDKYNHKCLTIKKASIINIPYPDNYFDKPSLSITTL